MRLYSLEARFVALTVFFGLHTGFRCAGLFLCGPTLAHSLRGGFSLGSAELPALLVRWFGRRGHLLSRRPLHGFLHRRSFLCCLCCWNSDCRLLNSSLLAPVLSRPRLLGGNV